MLIEVQDKYATIFQTFDAPSVNIEEALRRYALEYIQLQILKAETEVQQWEEKYQSSYDLFLYRTATDEAYVQAFNQNKATQLWEGDAISWEVAATELKLWRARLHQLLSK